MRFFWILCLKIAALGMFACSTLEERQPPWRKAKVPVSKKETLDFTPPGAQIEEEYDDMEGGKKFPFLDQSIVSKLPPVEFDWPVEKPFLTNYFGWRKKRMHDGVDLRAPVGTPVYAAAKGTVLYASRKIKGYGRMIILNHGEGWSTLYAHLSKIEVKVGDSIEQGERLGLSGKSGRVRGPHLHFELRSGADPVDPLLFFPLIESE
jgi:murein DD-endopeptidase MepM/ murein hydrolase activator NlpD